MERTFALIKPDAVKAGHSGAIINRIEREGFAVIGMRKMSISRSMAEQFYGVHSSRPFYGELVDFITSGPVIAMVLEKDKAISAWRTLMGATNPAQAAEGTLRKEFATSIGNNAVHGSDPAETAPTEIALFFPELC